MAVAYTDVQALSSEFASLAQAKIDPFLERARRRVNETYFGNLYDDAVLYMAAHMLACAEAGSSGPGGAVTGKTVGSIGVTYAAPAWAPEGLNQTVWGREFKALARAKYAGGFVV